MQVLTTKARAWNWLTNTADGVKMVYYEKLDIALQHWQDVKDANPDATKWTAKQLEDSAVGKYGPHAGVGWYWNWNDAPDKKKWEPTSHAGLKNYVENIRERAETECP